MLRRAIRAGTVGACAFLCVGVGTGAPAATTPLTTTTAFTSVGEHVFVVPANVSRVHIDLVGGAGGAGANGASGGLGGVAAGDLDVTPGEPLYVEVGSAGGNASGATGGTAGANGGGRGGNAGSNPGQPPGPNGSGGGGGASDVRTETAATVGSLDSRLLVAGGGGGGSGASPTEPVEDGVNASSDPTGPTTTKNQQGGSANATTPGDGGAIFPSQPGAQGQGGVGGGGNGLAGGSGGGGEFGGGSGSPTINLNVIPGGGGGGSDFLASSVINGTEGVATAGEAPSVTITATVVAPQLGKLRGQPTRFRAAKRGPSVAKHGGMLVSYTDSTASVTTFTVKGSARGVRVGGRCVAPRHGTTGHRCTRVIKLGSFQVQDQIGTNRVHFSGRIRGHALRPGHYTLVAAPMSSGLHGNSSSLGFVIKG